MAVKARDNQDRVDSNDQSTSDPSTNIILSPVEGVLPPQHDPVELFRQFNTVLLARFNETIT